MSENAGPRPDNTVAPSPTDTTGDQAHHHDRHHDHHHAERLWETALRGEQMTGHHEETDAEAQRNLLLRFARTALGFFIIAVGIATLPLPGPGWLIILLGLNQLPFAWAKNTIRLIRAKIPGVPTDGRIPPRSIAIMVGIVVVASVASYLWARPLAEWLGDRWSALTASSLGLEAIGSTWPW